MGDVTETTVVRSFSSSMLFTNTLLASGAIYQSNWIDTINGEKFLSLMAITAQSGTYTAQFTEDTTQTSPASAYFQSTQTFMVSGGVASICGAIPIPTRYFRVVYKNGLIAQTGIFELMGSLNANMSNTFGTYNAALTPLMNGQSIPLQLDAAGNQKINVVSGLGSSVGNPIYTATSGASGTPNPAILTDTIGAGIIITVTDGVVPAPTGVGAFINGPCTAGSYAALANPGGMSSWNVQITGITTSGTLYFEASLDSTTGIDGNWIAVNGRQSGILNTVDNYFTTMNGNFRGNVSGMKYFRVRAVGALAGTPNILIRFSSGTGAIFLDSSLPSGNNLIGNVNIASEPADIVISGVISVTDGVVGAPLGTGILISGAPTAGSYVAAANPGGASMWIIQITGITTSGTLYFEESMDSTNGIDGNWITANVRQTGILNSIITNSATANGIYKGNCSSLKYGRVRAVGTLAGTPTIIIRFSVGVGSVFLTASLPAGANTLGNVNIASEPADIITTGLISVTDGVVVAPIGNGVLLGGAPTAGSYVAAANIGGTSTWNAQITGITTNGTLYFETSLDSTAGNDGNWIAVNGIETGVVNAAINYYTIANGIFQGNCAGAKWFRVRAVGTLAGTPTVLIRFSTGLGTVALNSALPAGNNTIGTVNVGITPDFYTSGLISVTDGVVPTPLGNGVLLGGAPTAGSFVALSDPGGLSAWNVQITGLTSGALYFEASLDATAGNNGNWIVINGVKIGSSNANLGYNAITNGVFQGNMAGGKYFRVRASGALTGTPTVIIRLSTGIGTIALNASLPPGINSIGTVNIGSEPADIVTSGVISVTDSVIGVPLGTGILISGAPTAGSYVVAANTGGTSTWIAQITGITTSGTLYFEASLDSTTGIDGNWIAVNGRQSGILNSIIDYFTITNGIFEGNSSAIKYFRVRAVGTLAGTPTVIIRFSTGNGTIALNAPIQNIIDTGRQIFTMYFDPAVSSSGVAGVPTDTIMSMTTNVNGIITTGLTLYTVPVGKVLRIQTFATHATTTSANLYSINEYRLRAMISGGTLNTSSPIFLNNIIATGTNNADHAIVSISDGLEFPAGATIGISQMCSNSTLRFVSVNLIGFLY